MVVEGGFEPPKDDVQLIYSQSRLATSLFHQYKKEKRMFFALPSGFCTTFQSRSNESQAVHWQFAFRSSDKIE